MDETTITIGGMRTSAGIHDVKVRWPSDEEWTAHHRLRKIFRRDLGRGAFENEIESGAADAKLYEAIKLDGAPPLTVAEASYVIEKIGFTDVVGVELRAEDAEVEIQTALGKVKHTVRIPTIDETKTLNRTSRYITLPYNRSEIRPNLEAGAALWDKCGGRAEGYNGPVPNIHKDVAIRNVIDAINQEVAPRNDEANF